MSQLLATPETSPFKIEGVDNLGGKTNRAPMRLEHEWFWTQHPAVVRCLEEFEVAKKFPSHILIIGETGTGKELVSRMLHAHHKSDLGLSLPEAPFLALNCGAIPEGIVESLLFGHERGTFTSARDRQIGKFEQAKRGILFLDEVQALSASIQVKLLRVLQDQCVQRLGGKIDIELRCRVLAASNIPLEILVDKGLFRKDLYFRLNVCPIYIPPLRARIEDIPHFIQHFCKKHSSLTKHKIFSPSAMQYLQSYTWPGNLRELEHCVMYASLRAKKEIGVEHLPDRINGKLKQYIQNGEWN